MPPRSPAAAAGNPTRRDCRSGGRNVPQVHGAPGSDNTEPSIAYRVVPTAGQPMPAPTTPHTHRDPRPSVPAPAGTPTRPRPAAHTPPPGTEVRAPTPAPRPVSASTSSTISDGTLCVSSPRCPGADTPAATRTVRVTNAMAQAAADLADSRLNGDTADVADGCERSSVLLDLRPQVPHQKKSGRTPARHCGQPAPPCGWQRAQEAKRSDGPPMEPVSGQRVAADSTL